MTEFNELGLHPSLIQALEETGYTTPTPIQAQAIPLAMAGRDVLGIAQTGTGKTAAFALPILHKLANTPGRPPRGGMRCLVLSPTRELASQIADSFKTYGKHMGLSVVTVFGGVGHAPQIRDLARGVDIVVATPGRLQDHLDSRHARLDHVQIMVLDEADQMLDKGFLPPIRKILRATPPTGERQTLFFSATMPTEIAKLAAEMLSNPARVEVTPVATTAERVAQRVIHLEAGGKRAMLAELLRAPGVGRALVFSRTKHGADKIVKNLEADGLAANAIHGNKGQTQRERALDQFKRGTAPILVATDIAARGIDVDGVTHVIQHDLPEVPETYVHRIGRTARAGASGEAIALCAPDDQDKLRAIEKLTRQAIPTEDRRTDQSRALPPPGNLDVKQFVRPHGAPKPKQNQGRGGRGGAPGQSQRAPQAQRSAAPSAPRSATSHEPRGAAAQGPRGATAPQGPRGGDATRQRPERDRNWREGDFRDTAPAFITRGR